MPTPDGFRVTQQVPGGDPIDLTMDETSAVWTSTVPGGFGSATISIPRALTLKERGLLGGITIEYEGRVLFEGRVEDDILKWGKASVGTDLQAFGLQRLLTDNSVRRIWSLRKSLNPQIASVAKGASSIGTLALRQDVMVYAFGNYSVATPSFWPTGYLNAAFPMVNGFRILPSANLAAQDCGQVVITLPAGLTGARVMFDALIVDSGEVFGSLLVHSTADGTTYTRHYEQQATGGRVFANVDVALVNNATEIRISQAAVGGAVTGNGSGNLTYVEIANLRVLGTNLREDQAGGFYGSSIIRDAISFAPGIYPGTIENGTDFAISEISRVNRTSILDVVQQVDALYAREWGVWEGGRFDWITPNLKDAGWVIPLAQTTEGQIERSIDTLHKRTYVPFTDAADGLAKEAFADTGSARNPYVRLGLTKDGIVSAPAAMTALTAPTLAAKLNNDFGRWPDIKGSVTLLAGTMIDAANSARSVPAFAIRAGDNITIPDLPVEDIYAAGQDGQSVFHVTGVDSGTDGNVKLTLEGLTRRADVLMARLGAVSQ